jgi:hypothetical protein
MIESADFNGGQSARNDAFSFYSMTVISYLESAVSNYVENLDVIFKDNPPLVDWLDNVWLHEEAEHGLMARQFVEETWPEYNWQKGYDQFLIEYGPRCAHEELRASPGLEALARCVTETQATMSYRCLISYSSDPKLRELMKRMSTDEVRHYREKRVGQRRRFIDGFQTKQSQLEQRITLRSLGL